MSRRTFAILFFAAILSFPLSAQPISSITPSSGSTAGGTEVTIKGTFPGSTYTVSFAGVAAATQRVDGQTLLATTPKHLPGRFDVQVIDADGAYLYTNLTFTFFGEVPSNFERVLLPIFIPPVKGQFGSEFVTSFTAAAPFTGSATLHGLTRSCGVICLPIPAPDVPVQLTPQNRRIDSEELALLGTPGRFVYIDRSELDGMAMNLRVYDRTRTAQNYGTELPVVRESQFTEGYTTLTLINVPTDANFRNTLRIYATGQTHVLVTVESPRLAPVDHNILLTGGESIFEPATATLTDFPTNVGLATVTITMSTPPITLPPAPNLWAFVTVTNNDTQLITTVTPQP